MTQPPRSTSFPYTTLFRSNNYKWLEEFADVYPKEIGIPWNCNIRYDSVRQNSADLLEKAMCYGAAVGLESGNQEDRKSTRLNSSHLGISYAVFCLKKKTKS